MSPTISQTLLLFLFLTLLSSAHPAPPSIHLDPQPIAAPLVPAIPLDHSLSDERSSLTTSYLQHQFVLLSRIHATPRSPNSYVSASSQMRSLFAALSTSHPSTSRQNSILSHINTLRSSHRFPSRIDPGIHLTWGTPWDFSRHGPYPAARLARVESLGVDADAARVELENAVEALDRQTWVEAAEERPRMVFTDDTGLLRSAVEYYRRVLG